MSQSYYELLSISKNATAEEIRSGYKQMALKYHPDKAKDQSTIDKFISIKQAYETLSDPVKKRCYDNGGELFQSISFNFNDILQYILLSMATIYNQNKEQQVMKLSLNTTVEDIYNKKIKKVTLKVKRVDQNSLLFFDSTVTLYIPLESYESEYIFKSMGDQDISGRKQDILIRLLIIEDFVQIDKVLSKYDLFIEKTVSLYEYYYKKEFCLPYFNNQTITVAYHPGKRVTLVKNQGLPYIDEDDQEVRGDLYVHYNLKLPESIDDAILLEPFLEKYFGYN